MKTQDPKRLLGHIKGRPMGERVLHTNSKSSEIEIINKASFTYNSCKNTILTVQSNTIFSHSNKESKYLETGSTRTIGFREVR